MDMNSLLPQIVSYLVQSKQTDVPGWNSDAPFLVTILAQGEYNMNYLVTQEKKQWVLRVNIGTQINRADQIEYEYRALRLLEPTGVTPCPFFVDNSREQLDYGVLLMEYLPGSPLDYRRDLVAAARLFARIHSQSVNPEVNHLIIEERPLTYTYEECAQLLPVYLESELSDPTVCGYLRDVLAWAKEACRRDTYFVADPWPCIINTEVNSGNFIANQQAGTLHLVDWEKPLWGDPSQDLSHFCVPTTTLWKTDYWMVGADRKLFLNAYRAEIPDAHLRDTIEDRVRLRDPFNCLRGISWSAMAWVSYQTGDHTLRNEDTFQKIKSYLKLSFIRSLFAPYLQRRISEKN